MAIAFDAVTSFGTTSGGSPWTAGTHSASGSNRIAFVVCFGAGSGNITPSGVTYGGNAMTLIAGVIGGVNHRSTLWYLIAPPTGAQSVVITWSGGTTFMSGGAISYTGASQTGQPDASTTNTGSGSSLTTSNTSIADNCWNILLAGTNGATSAGTGSTARTSTGISWDIYDSNGPKTPAGSYSMTFNGVAGAVDAVMASFSPVTSTAFSRSQTDSIMLGASRTTVLTYAQVLARSASASIMNAASRFATVGRGFTRTMTDSIMNAASRFATLLGTFPTHISRALSDSIMNAKSRFATFIASFPGQWNFRPKNITTWTFRPKDNLGSQNIPSQPN